MKILVIILVFMASVYGAASSSSDWGPQFEKPDDFIPSAPPVEMMHPEQEFPSAPIMDETVDLASLEPDITEDHPMASRYFEYHLHRNNYDRIVKFIPIIRTLAEKEKPTALACYNYAILYEKGWETPTSNGQLFRWFHRAADLDDPRALYKLSQLYKEGKGCPKLPDTAAEKLKLAAKFGSAQAQHELGQYEKAAVQGYAPSQFKLGISYQEANPEEAMMRYKLAADQGDLNAAYSLGQLYYDLKDLQNARTYFLIAASGGHVLAQRGLGIVYLEEQDKKQSLHWFQLSAQEGDALSQYALGRGYELGQGVPKDPKLSWEWYNLSAKQGYILAYWAIGSIYERGSGVVNHNYIEAIKWYQRAAANGKSDNIQPFALRVKGRLYENGLFYAKNLQQAVLFYQLAVDGEDVDACGYLGCLYLYGRGVMRDFVRARELLEAGVALGSDVARNYLGVMLRDGLGIPENKGEALILFRAAAGTCPMAQSNLGLYYESTGQEHDLITASDLYARIEQTPYRRGSKKSQPRMREHLWSLDLVESSYNLGRMYKKGLGNLKKSYERAFYFYEYAAAHAHKEAMFQLSRMYEHGWGCRKDSDEAYRWRERAEQ